MRTILTVCFIGVIGLLGVGFYALLTTRHLIKLIIALQIMVKGAMLALIVAGKVSGQINLSQSLATTIVVADTIVAVIGMALAIQIKQQMGTLDIAELSKLKR
ncbi:MAG: NADH-quinone oxidoreductase subunit K [Anaerolineales bacterium]|nr:NADH-quinone oxidoreductase subunit K [Anaerolineales bacterium]